MNHLEYAGHIRKKIWDDDSDAAISQTINDAVKEMQENSYSATQIRDFLDRLDTTVDVMERTDVTTRRLRNARTARGVLRQLLSATPPTANQQP